MRKRNKIWSVVLCVALLFASVQVMAAGTASDFEIVNGVLVAYNGPGALW